MKIYVYHLVIYANELQKYANSNSEIYNLWNPRINEGVNNMIYNILDRLNCYKMENGKIIYTYAVTDNKEYAKIFERMHDMKLFKKTVWNMSKEEYENYKNQHVDPILNNFKIDNSHSIIATNIEHDMINDESLDSIIYALTFFVNFDYSAFHKKYIIALDKLLYCSLYKIYSDDDEDTEFYEYNFQYGITAEQTVNHPVSLSVNFESIYVGLLLPFLNKEVICNG